MHKTIRTFGSEIEAHLARTELETHGIKAAVHKFSRYRAIAGGGYLLKVSEEFASRAQKILSKHDAPVDMDEYISSGDDSYTRCPECHSVNVDKTPLTTGMFLLTVACLGLPLLFIQRDCACRKCGHAWRQ
ncbi:MAG: hypothetical protein QG656_1326 [Candidatus Hydrogenedentes bacterium]|nr:hypothetical protein [Candidatus Hydrogenedentota bacterium]